MPDKPAKPQRDRVLLVIEDAEPKYGDIRLRRLLKSMLRAYGWRCCYLRSVRGKPVDEALRPVLDEPGSDKPAA